MNTQARIDQWLWSVRLYKTRALAKTACDRGYVTVGGNVVKPSRAVKPADIVCVRDPSRASFEREERVLQIVSPLSKRVGAAVAAEAYVDLNPPQRPARVIDSTAPVVHRGEGRPTKRDRRKLEKMLGRDIFMQEDTDD